MKKAISIAMRAAFATPARAGGTGGAHWDRNRSTSP